VFSIPVWTDFLSRNCLREVVATLEYAKKYLFVREADPAKGGAPLEELKKELKNDDHRRRLFDETPHRDNVWYRIGTFQVVTLIHIVEDMLRQSRGFDETLNLFVPGSLLAQRLTFDRRVVLYTSSHNPGAAAAARELCEQFNEISVTEVPFAAGTSSSHHTIRRMSRQVTAKASECAAGIAAASRLRTASQAAVEMSGEQSAAGQTHAVSETTAHATHFLLYLNEQTFVDDDGALAKEVRGARAVGLPVVMIHENDSSRDGCEFSRFFQTTPNDLIKSGLYSALAISFVDGDAHRTVSKKLFAKSLGAEVLKHAARSSSLRGIRPSSAGSLRSSRNSAERRTDEVRSTDTCDPSIVSSC
jgi:hypothetical protein